MFNIFKTFIIPVYLVFIVAIAASYVVKSYDSNSVTQTNSQWEVCNDEGCTTYKYKSITTKSDPDVKNVQNELNKSLSK